ncbi:MAG: hypothetical protein V4702_00720 [Patescibacteria group bacterium]
MKNVKPLNSMFVLIQSLQVGLLVAQGLLLLLRGVNELSLPIWFMLCLAAAAQSVVALNMPKKVDMSALVDRSAIVKLRLFAIAPYALIVAGILYSQQ